MPSQGQLPKRFSELRIAPGDAFNVETIKPPKRYPVRLLGYCEGHSILVAAPRIQGKSFLLPEGQLLRVRLMADNVACGFETRVLHNCRTPFLYTHLEYPREIKSVTVRQASRVTLALPVLAEEQNPGAAPGPWPKQGRIIDMSSGGARIECQQPLAAVGTALRLRFRVTIDAVERDLVVNAVVRNIAEVGQEAVDAAFQYGVQFIDLGDNERIVVTGYVYEQILISRNRR